MKKKKKEEHFSISGSVGRMFDKIDDSLDNISGKEKKVKK